MAEAARGVTARYDAAAPAWGDKMRSLGYHDAYLGFLAAGRRAGEGTEDGTGRGRGDPGGGPADGAGARVIDVGAGTAALAEAWIAIHGPPREMTLLDPSRAMLERGRSALRRWRVEPRLLAERLGESDPGRHDAVLAAHVIEHCPDPGQALAALRDLLRPGGRLHLVVSKPHWCNAIIWLQWRHRTFGEAEILGLMARAGLAVERVHAFPKGPPSRTSRGLVARRAD